MSFKVSWFSFLAICDPIQFACILFLSSISTNRLSGLLTVSCFSYFQCPQSVLIMFVGLPPFLILVLSFISTKPFAHCFLWSSLCRGGGVTFSMPYFLTTRLYPCSITHTDKLVKHLAHIFYYLYIFRVLKSLCRLSLLYEPLYSPSLSLSPIPTTPLMAHCFLCFFCFQFRNFFHLSLAVN